MSWLMKTASIELRVTSLNRQRSHTQRLLHLLLDDMPVKPYSGAHVNVGIYYIVLLTSLYKCKHKSESCAEYMIISQRSFSAFTIFFFKI